MLKRAFIFLFSLICLVLSLIPAFTLGENSYWKPLILNQAEQGELPEVETFVYGQSELGRDLYCTRVGSREAERKILMVFAVHGFEDLYAHDGEILMNIAHEMLTRYAAGEALVENVALYIVPCANPDGLEEGINSHGFGRCNALKLDINRDFPVEWSKSESVRYLTGDSPLSTAEARALVSLINEISPTWGGDVHGFLSGVYGPDNLTQPFRTAMGVVIRQETTGGKLSQYLNAQCPEGGLLIELKKPETIGGPYIREMAGLLMEGIALVEGAKTE